MEGVKRSIPTIMIGKSQIKLWLGQEDAGG
jgi:hypothetical protein